MRDTRSLASRLRDRIRIERPVADDSLDGAGSGSWELVQDDVAAEIEDMLPSRGERIANGINVTAGPARVRVRYRTDITSSMRVVEILSDSGNDIDGRILQIVTRPAKLGREALEFVCEEYVPAGNPA